jgi:hypothetical protein
LPGKVLVLNTVGLVLQYVLLLLVYYFLYRVSRMIYQDLKGMATVSSAAREIDETTAKQQPAELKVIESDTTALQGKVFHLGEATTIGRGEHNDIRIDDGFVSHEHSCITRYKDKYWLADLQSTNHTYLNGQHVTDEVMLESEDVIKIGTVTFKFER